MKKHGVELDHGKPVFWWMGQRVTHDEFNAYCRESLNVLVDGWGEFTRGMDLGAITHAGHLEVAKIDQVEQILKLPLCDTCRKLIGG